MVEMLTAGLVAVLLCGCVFGQVSPLQPQCASNTLKIGLSSHYNESGHWQSEVEFVQCQQDSLPVNKWVTEVEQRTEEYESNLQVLKTTLHLKAPVSSKSGTKSSSKIIVPDGYKQVEGVGVVKSSSSVQNYATANKDCAKDGAFLMVIDSQQKLDFVNAFMNLSSTFSGASNNRDIWVGVEVQRGEWKTVQGVLLRDIPSFKWYTKRPADGHCTVFGRLVQSHWDTNECTSPTTRLSYICEMPIKQYR